ncbi:MAG TPA: hypothetical protein VN132_13045 [Bdellovibrio sp.]|nr:hypothetical protein [Bdellovibrio sp.]
MVKTKILQIDKLTESQVIQMFRMMDQYYAKMTEETFRRDLSEKQKVILLLGEDGLIKGFSTILQISMISRGRSFIAIFSGDTVLQQEYWGNGALATAFGRYLTEVKLKNPFTRVYWFLISKGYKTYLLMTNNFPVHYPRHERATPNRYQNIMDVFYKMRFGEKYNPAQGLIHFENSKASYLKWQVAEIDESLRLNQRISFFEQRNPQWKEGVELACIAKVTLWIPLRYAIKRVIKGLRGRESKAAVVYQGSGF